MDGTSSSVLDLEACGLQGNPSQKSSALVSSGKSPKKSRETDTASEYLDVTSEAFFQCASDSDQD